MLEVVMEAPEPVANKSPTAVATLVAEAAVSLGPGCEVPNQRRQE
jgi:hypothetical protein